MIFHSRGPLRENSFDYLYIIIMYPCIYTYDVYDVLRHRAYIGSEQCINNKCHAETLRDIIEKNSTNGVYSVAQKTV